MSNFSKAKKYYTKKEVEEQLKVLMNKSEFTILNQKEQIFELKTKIEKLQKESNELKKREKLIANALGEATDNSRIAMDFAKKSRMDEIEHLTEFCAKWSVLFAQVLPQKDVSKFSDEFDQILLDMKHGAGRGEIARRKELEVAREKIIAASIKMVESNQTIEERYAAVLEKCDAKKKQDDVAIDSGFNLEEAVNPTASLEEIMKDIFKTKRKK